MNKDLETLYERAVEDASFRQEFVDSLNLGEMRKYISKLVVKRRQRRNWAMMCLNPILGLRRGVKMIIYPLAFSKEFHPNAHDFLSSLRDHEGHHMFQGAYGAVTARNGEIDAWENTLKNLSSKNSPRYRKRVKKSLDYYKYK